jgi:hypothetical protein
MLSSRYKLTEWTDIFLTLKRIFQERGHDRIPYLS